MEAPLIGGVSAELLAIIINQPGIFRTCLKALAVDELLAGVVAQGETPPSVQGRSSGQMMS